MKRPQGFFCVFLLDLFYLIFGAFPLHYVFHKERLLTYKFIICENIIHIPHDLYPDKTLVIRYVFKNFMSPMELGLSNNSRKLGIGISSFYIAEVA